MTDPSLYQFSDAFYNALQAAQERPVEDDGYYYPEDDYSQQTPSNDDSDYGSMYDDLQQKYEDQQALIEQLQQQIGQYNDPTYQESVYQPDDPNYTMDFVWRNVLNDGGHKDNTDYSSSDYSNTFQTFPTYQEGKNALIHQLDLYQTGKTRNPVKPTSTLKEAMNVYAPASDNNDPNAYVNFIAHQIGVSPDTPISNIDTEDWANAIERFEGNKHGNNPGNLKKFPDGGQVQPPKRRLPYNFPRPTSSDSLELYNRSLKLQDFYKNYKVNSEFNSDALSGKALHDYNEGIYNLFKDTYETAQKNPNEERRGNVINPNNGKRYIMTPEQYRMVRNPYQYFQRDLINAQVDPKAPIQLYDRRIDPQFDKNLLGPTGDVVDIFAYDPIAVKPWNMLTDEERQIRIKKYGYPKQYSTPVKTVPPIQHQENRIPPKPVMADTSRPALSSNGINPSLLENKPHDLFQLPEGKPVYGPTGSMIGVYNGQFYPDVKNTAKRGNVNQEDTDLLYDKTRLRKYLLSKGLNY